MGKTGPDSAPIDREDAKRQADLDEERADIRDSRRRISAEDEVKGEGFDIFEIAEFHLTAFLSRDFKIKENIDALRAQARESGQNSCRVPVVTRNDIAAYMSEMMRADWAQVQQDPQFWDAVEGILIIQNQHLIDYYHVLSEDVRRIPFFSSDGNAWYFTVYINEFDLPQEKIDDLSCETFVRNHREQMIAVLNGISADFKNQTTTRRGGFALMFTRSLYPAQQTGHVGTWAERYLSDLKVDSSALQAYIETQQFWIDFVSTMDDLASYKRVDDEHFGYKVTPKVVVGHGGMVTFSVLATLRKQPQDDGARGASSF